MNYFRKQSKSICIFMTSPKRNTRIKMLWGMLGDQLEFTSEVSIVFLNHIYIFWIFEGICIDGINNEIIWFFSSILQMQERKDVLKRITRKNEVIYDGCKSLVYQELQSERQNINSISCRSWCDWMISYVQEPRARHLMITSCRRIVNH